MAYIEKENVVHRDLRAVNIMVEDETFSCKIDVFGMAGLTKKNQNITVQCKFRILHAILL